MDPIEFLKKYATKENKESLKEDLKELLTETVKKNMPPMIESSYQDDLDLIDKLLSVYCLSKGIVVRNFELRVLKYYIKYGYNSEAKEYIKEDEKRKDGDIRTADVYLRRNGLLLPGETNFRKTTLSKDMESIRDMFINNFSSEKNKIYGVLFRQQT